MKSKSNHNILLINPWIYDFAAFDLWAKPIGLLYIGSLLRKNGYMVHYIDCLDIHTPDMEDATGIEPAKRKGYGTGRFYKENVVKPDCLKDIPKDTADTVLLRKYFKESLKGSQCPT